MWRRQDFSDSQLASQSLSAPHEHLSLRKALTPQLWDSLCSRKTLNQNHLLSTVPQKLWEAINSYCPKLLEQFATSLGHPKARSQPGPMVLSQQVSGEDCLVSSLSFLQRLPQATANS